MNLSFAKSVGFMLHKKLLNLVLKKSCFLHSSVSLRNKCGSKGPPWRILFFGNDDFSVTSLRLLTTKMYLSFLSI